MAELVRKLKSYEEDHKYAKYLERERGHVKITPNDFKEIKLEEVIYPNETEKLLSANNLGNGFSKIPGGVYAQQTIELNGVTSEMLNWWFAFYPLESYRYLMWMPESHHSVAIAECDMEKILNPLVPIEYKSKGVIHAMLKDEGRGMKEVNIRFLDPLNVGFNMGNVKKAGVGGIFVGWRMEQSLDQLALPNRFPARNYSVEIIIVKDTENGVAVNLFTWIGFRYDCDGKAASCIPPFVDIPKEAAFGALMFNPQEWNALTEFLPELYKECEGKIM